MNDRGPINRERFVALLDAYGAEPSRWPEAERADAQALLASDPELQRLHTRALELDRLLDAGVALAPSPALRRAVAEIPLRAERGAAPALPWLFASALRSALAAAFVLGLGVLAGTSSSADALLSGTASSAGQSDAAGASATATTAEASAAAESDDPLDSLLELAFNTHTHDEEQAQ
jgi:anti-sigma factor RsiW